ncbi:MAG: hypothetical protein AAF415_14290 [Pseudomonadota bacterium]
MGVLQPIEVPKLIAAGAQILARFAHNRVVTGIDFGSNLTNARSTDRPVMRLHIGGAGLLPDDHSPGRFGADIDGVAVEMVEADYALAPIWPVTPANALHANAGDLPTTLRAMTEAFCDLAQPAMQDVLANMIGRALVVPSGSSSRGSAIIDGYGVYFVRYGRAADARRMPVTGFRLVSPDPILPGRGVAAVQDCLGLTWCDADTHRCRGIQAAVGRGADPRDQYAVARWPAVPDRRAPGSGANAAGMTSLADEIIGQYSMPD